MVIPNFDLFTIIENMNDNYNILVLFKTTIVLISRSNRLIIYSTFAVNSLSSDCLI